MTKIYKKRQGFTLIEIIVVLVVMAILAAISVPAVLGYVEDARRSEAIWEAHNAMEAAQYIIIHEYAKETSFDSWRGFTNITDKYSDIKNQIYEVSGIDKNKYVIANIDVNAKNKLIFMNFYSKNKVNGEYNRIVYMNGTIGGKTYHGEFIVATWNGVVYHEYRTLDPSQVGYKKE